MSIVKSLDDFKVDEIYRCIQNQTGKMVAYMVFLGADDDTEMFVCNVFVGLRCVQRSDQLFGSRKRWETIE